MPCISCLITVLDEFGAGVLEITPQSFSEKGFEFGDTVDLRFSNGFALNNVPYFNGFYVPIGTPVIVAYPNYEHPTIDYNCANFHEISGVNAGDTVTITMHEKGALKDVMDLRGVVYSNDPRDYQTLEQFANAREFRTGKIAAGKLYRCASPFDHQMNRPGAVDAFLRKHQVQTTFSISETEKTLEERYHDMPPYARRLYETGHAIPLGLGADYFGKEFAEKLVRGFICALDAPFPWAIHCLEGKDRTGFVCILLGCLMEAEHDEMLADYMKTFDNYYGITFESDPIRYNGFKTTFFDSYLKKFCELAGDPDASSQNYCQGAAAYLKMGGMTDEQIERLKQILSE